ncbi:MAG: hypothetical protein COB81_10000 [Flavobacteriaceae bacterium]|nr:MAG: hypothetical protein COB81_10000 [Flavobacteriaceae bacterium]
MIHTLRVFQIALIFASLTACKNEQANESSTLQKETKQLGIQVKTQKIATNNIHYKLAYNGSIIPLKTADLSFLVPGTIQSLPVEDGVFIKKGQLIARLDKSSFYNSYKAALATQHQANDAFERLKKVYDSGSLPAIKWEEINAKVKQANASVQIAKKNVDNCMLRAPFAGIIANKSVAVSNNVIPSVQIVQLIDINDVYIHVSVPESEINSIKIGQTCSITVSALSKTPIAGKVHTVAVMSQTISKTYVVKIKVGNKNHELKPGMVCKVTIKTALVNSLITVPYASVLEDTDNQYYVFVVGPGSDNALKKSVKLGRFVNNQIEVISGLSSNDLLIVNGQHKLKNNSKILL